MRSKKNALIKILLAMGLSVLSIGLVACGSKKKPNKNEQSYGETGIYYYSAAEDEYQLSLDGTRFTLTIDNELKTGTYAYDGTTLNLYVEGEDALVGAIADNVLTVSYNGGSYSFYKKISYTVSYDVDGSAVETAKVVNGKTLVKPADPVKKGYDFIGWYADKDYRKPFAFHSDVITADTTLYARFVERGDSSYEYVATMYADGSLMDSETTIGGVLYDLPTPKKDGDTFAGWWVSDYQNEDKPTYKYEGQTLTQDVNLYAVWASDGMQVSVSDTSISWSALMTGIEYVVSIVNEDGDALIEPYMTTALSMNYDFSKVDAGDYTVSVTAEGQTAVAYYKNKSLDRVSGFSVVEPSILRFNSVANATTYYVTAVCGNSAHTHTFQNNGNSTYFNFANCSMKEGGIVFTVTARGKGYTDSVSDAFVFNRQLDAVENVNYNANTGALTWDSVDKAIFYEIEVTAGEQTETYEVNGTALSLKQYAGDVSVKITAAASGYNSAKATVYTYTNANLATPSVKVSEDKIVWNEVAGATGYVVMLDSNERTVAAGATEFALPEAYQTAGVRFTVAVKAVSANASSLYSEAINVTYGQFDQVLYAKGTLKWIPVGGAHTYSVKVDNEEASTYDSLASAAKVVFTHQGVNRITVTAYDFEGRMLDQETVAVDAYQISFDSRGGSFVKPIYLAVGDEVVLPEPTYTGSAFAGWYSVPDGPASNGAKYEEKYFSGKGSTTLYAYWEAQAFEITLKVARTILDQYNRPQVFYETIGTVSVYYKKGYELPIPTSKDDAKVFGGWYEDDSLSSFQYTDALGRSKSNWSILGDKVLYAGWLDLLTYEKYQDVDGYAYRVTGGQGARYVKELTIPATYTDSLTKETLPVLSIGTGAFAGYAQLETLNIPDTLKSIFLAFGSTTSTFSTGSALYECRGLKDINVYCIDEDGVHDENSTHQTYYQSIDGLLIRHASPIDSKLEYGVELAFVPHAKKGTLVVPDVVEHIPMRTFYNMVLDKVVIPHTVIRIGERAFYRNSCREIIFKEAPAGVDEKPLSLSEGCLNVVANLTKLVLPARIGLFDFHGEALFRQNINLTHVDVAGRPAPEQGNNYYSSVDGVICNYNKTKLVFYPTWRRGSYTVPVEIQAIGERAFLDVQDIDKVIIKDNVVEIEREAFINCSTIKSVIFDYDRGSLSIGEKAFYGCTGLSNIVLPEQLEYVGSQAFGNTPALTSVTINGSTSTVLKEKAFADDFGVGYLTSVHMGANVPAFEINKVFYGCKLYVLDIDKNNQNFHVDKQGVLYNKEQTKILYYPFGLTADYTIPSTVTEIGEGVFENRANITSIEIPAHVTKISARAFKNCVGLQTLTFAQRTTDLVIEEQAFADCLSLESVSLPEGVTELVEPIFVGCSGLKSLYIPASLTDLDFAKAFEGCKKLANIEVAETNEVYVILDGIFYTKEIVDGKSVPTSILYVPKGLTGDLVIPSTISVIKSSVFNGHTGITSIAFENDKVLGELKLGQSVFAGMTSLKSVRLPDGLYSIPQNAFRGSALQSVYVPNTVVELHKGAFAECTKLTTVTLQDGSNPLYMGSGDYVNGVFYNTKSLTEIVLPDRMTTIPAYMFSNSAITTIDFPANVYVISTGAFINCTNLTSFDMPDTVDVLGSFVFSGCTSLKSVTLSDALTSIPNYLFGKAPKGAAGSALVNSSQGNASSGESVIKPSNTILAKVISGPREDVVAATAFTSIVIPAAVEKIGKYAFHGCTGLATVEFASNEKVTTLGAYAFAESGIKAFDMPDSVNGLGEYLFTGCESLATLTISDSVTGIPQFLCSPVIQFGSILEDAVMEKPLTALKEIVIPAGVTSIGQYAFYKSGLETLTFASGNAINTIETSAFEGSKITNLTLPAAGSGTTTLGMAAFKDCNQLASVSLPNTVKDGLAVAFIGCSSIAEFAIENDGDGDITNDIYSVDAENLVVYNGEKTEIRLYLGTSDTFDVPEGVTKIHYNAFRGNTSLKYISLPASLQIIEDGAFAFCTSLVKATFPENSQLRSIGFRAFAFSSIQEITIPASVNSMGTHTYALGAPVNIDISKYAEGSRVLDGWDSTDGKSGWEGRIFEECTSLKTVNVKTVTLCESMFSNCTALESVTLNDNTSTFNGYTFYNCASLKSIQLPSRLMFVGVQEFMLCGLTSIHIPSGLLLNTQWYGASAYGANMFADCTDLETVTMDDSYTVIAPSMFANTAIKSFKMPANIQKIGPSAFFNIPTLEEIIFPETFVGDLEIGDSAFVGASLLSGGFDFSAIPTLTMESSAFQNCTSLEWIKLPDSFTDILRMTFYGCTKLQTVEAKGVKTIAHSAFFNCHSLESFTTSADATAIESHAFENCYALTEFAVPDSITMIEEGTFMNAGLTSINLGSGITDIAPYAFYGTKLTSVKIPASVANIDFTSFLACENMEYFEVDPANTSYKGGDNGELYNAENILLSFPASSKVDGGVFMMPLTSILGEYAFYGAKYINSVELSPATSIVPLGAFENSSIKVIELSSNVMEIADYAFRNCTQLTAVRIPFTVSWIGESAFEGCIALSEIEIPRLIVEIMPFTFKGCISLTSIKIPSDVETIHQGAFEGSGLTSIIIPETVLVLGSEVYNKEGVGYEGAVFANCTSLQSVVFEGATKVYTDMFAGCTALTSVTFANGWTEIADGMFAGCTLLSVEIPATVETVGENAFAGWTAQQTITINIPLEKANELWGEGWNGKATVVVK